MESIVSESDRVWVACERCDGTGVTFHECEDDTCVCSDAPDEDCRTCNGFGGAYENEDG